MALGRADAFCLVGNLVDSLNDWSLRIATNDFLVVGANGTILHRGENVGSNLRDALEKYSVTLDSVIKIENGEFIMPGLMDSHIHASQFPNAGLALDLPLLKWLDKYTFPTEKQFEDAEYATKVYDRVVEATLASGTTSASYFATIHKKTCDILCDMAEQRGQRALVGKVCMNRNGPNDYLESTIDSLNDAHAFVTSVQQRRNDLIHPIVTPRFAVSCDRALLVGLGDLAAKFNIRVQSHLSESKPEVQLMKELEPDCLDYTSVYAKAGLLTSKTIMAHCVHLSEQELNMLKNFEVGIAHCPNSNCSIRSGNMDVRLMQLYGIKTGLGTDCSAGFTVSMMDSMRYAVCVSNQLSMTRPPGYKPLTFADVLYLATRGSAQVMSLDHVVGALEPGMQFDALRVNLNAPNNMYTSLFGHESMEDMVHKFVFLGDDRNIVQVWVKGRKVKDLLLA